MHTRYHFNVGDSSQGPVGFCAELCAHTPQAALDLLREELLDMNFDGDDFPAPGVGSYLNVYFNSGLVTVDDIDVQTECNCGVYDDKSEKEG